MHRAPCLFLSVALSAVCVQAQQMSAPMTDAQKAAAIKSATAAAPRDIGEHATVIVPGDSGRMTVAREGTNGWTCIPDDRIHSGAMCADSAGMRWAQALMSHADRPPNTSPGVIYMLAGGTDVSATDPWARPTGGRGIVSGPHYMVMWPFAAASGLSTTPKSTGTWIMWSGTPYAHLMVNGVP
jgi:hypothetical protein